MLVLVRVAIAVLLLAAGAWAQASPERVYVGSEPCMACHQDIANGFNRNPHFKSIASQAEPPERTGCEGCHGPGGQHVANAGDKTKIIRFPELSSAQVLDNCLGCHAKDLGKMNIRRSAHSTSEVSCISCHSIHHSPERTRLLAKQERDVCYECHLDIRARFELPFKHRVNEGAINCSDCHNPHGAPTATWGVAQTPRMVSQSLGNDLPCLKCHTDKRGPFVFEHAPVRVEGCPTCHNPHGSTNPRLLSRPAVFTMCLECHNSVMGFGLRGDGILNPNSGFHKIAEPRFQNCVTCHVRIHGSNSDSLFRR